MAGGVIPSRAEDVGVEAQAIPEAVYIPSTLPSSSYTPSSPLTSTPVPLTPALSAANYFNPYVAMSQAAAQGGNPALANPYALMGGATTTPRPTTSNPQAPRLSDLSKQYMTQADTAIAKQKADMIAESQAAMKSYQEQRAREEAAAAEAARIREYNLRMAELNRGGDDYSSNPWISEYIRATGASGGLASLKGFDK